jgi:hypothetical protein
MEKGMGQVTHGKPWYAPTKLEHVAKKGAQL